MFFDTLFKNVFFSQRSALILTFILSCCSLFPSLTLAETSTLSIGKTAVTTDEAIDMLDAILSVMSRLSEEQEEQRALRNRMTAKDISSDELKGIENSLARKHVTIRNLKEDIDNVFTGINVKELKRRKGGG